MGSQERPVQGPCLDNGRLHAGACSPRGALPLLTTHSPGATTIPSSIPNARVPCQEATALASQRLMRATFFNFALAAGVGLVSYRLLLSKGSLQELEDRVKSYEARIQDLERRAKAANSAVDANAGGYFGKAAMGDAVKKALWGDQ